MNMQKILSRLFYLLKYLLLIAAFGITFLGIIKTYQRLEKDLMEAIPTLLPFAVLLVVFIVNLFIKKKVIKDNLLYNLTACLALGITLVIGLRAMFDTGMLLHQRYAIGFNPLYFSDNLSSVRIMLYALAGANVVLMISTVFDKKKIVNKKDSETEVEK